jgi:hypothetical protein
VEFHGSNHLKVRGRSLVQCGLVLAERMHARGNLAERVLSSDGCELIATLALYHVVVWRTRPGMSPRHVGNYTINKDGKAEYDSPRGNTGGSNTRSSRYHRRVYGL